MSEVIGATNDQELEPGDVVQIDPFGGSKLGGCFLVITEKKSFGGVGYVPVPTDNGVLRAFYRFKTEEVEYIGPGAWLMADPGEVGRIITP